MRRRLPRLLPLLALCVLASPLRAASLHPGDVLAADRFQDRVVLVSASDGAMSVVTTSPLPADPGCAVLAPDGGFYVALSYQTAGIVRVDPLSGTWTWLVPMGGFKSIYQMALDTDGALLVLDSNAGSTSVSRVALPGGAVSVVVPASPTMGSIGGFAVRPSGDLFLGTSGKILRWSRALAQSSLFVNTAETYLPGPMALLPASNALVVAFATSTLDIFKIVPFNATTGAKGTETSGFNLIMDITVMPDGTPAISDGGSQVWRIPAPGTRTVLFQSFPPGPIGYVGFRGLGFVDAATPVAPATWGGIKARYR
jgi:hypothetical protein